MRQDDFFAFLGASLSRVAAEAPEAYRALASAIGGMRARLIADGIARTIRFDFPYWTIYSGGDELDIGVTFGRETVIGLIDGQLTLEEAIYEERLLLRGAVETVEDFYGGLIIYLEGLIRSPGASALLRGYREAKR
jgi:hypothetical protein